MLQGVLAGQGRGEVDGVEMEACGEQNVQNLLYAVFAFYDDSVLL